MTIEEPAPLLDASTEISRLIQVLHATDQRLEELLAGEVDSVMDAEGRTILLRHAQGRVRESEIARQAAILNALPAQIALLDQRGVIVSVNEAWLQFAHPNGMHSPGHAMGLSYLDLCDNALGANSGEARQIAAGLRAVLGGKAATFSIEYPCHSPAQQRWFVLTVTPLAGGAVVMHVDVSARKLADNALAALSEKTGRRERMLSTMLASIIDFAYVFDRDGRFLFANKPLLDLWGTTLDQVVGRNFFDLGYAPELAAKFHGQVREVFETKAHVSDETPYADSAGKVGHYEYIFSPAFAPDGSVEFVVGWARDITERDRSDTALRQSIADFRALAEAMPQIVWVTKPDGANIYFNRQWMEYTGLTLEESVGTGWQARIHPEDRKSAVDDWNEARKTNGRYSTETRLLRADGTYRWWLVRGVALIDDAGAPLKWIGTCTDIDDLKRAELEILRANRELQRQREELRVLFDLVPAMIWFKDTENNILRVNQRVAKMIGKPVDEIEGHATTEIYPTKAARLYEEDLKVIRTGIAMPAVPEPVVDGQGNALWIERAKIPYHDENGKVIGIVVMGLDVTERKRDQDALRELNAELEVRVRARTAELDLARDEAEQANRAKSAFLATMSHEIRTPMNGVIGMIEVLQQTSLQGYQVEMIDLIRDSAFALLKIIEDILDFSRIEAGKLTVDNEPMRLAQTVENVCGMVDHLAAKRRVRMTTFVDPAIPATVLGDQSRLRQVLVNLTGNAIKFSGGRETQGSVAVRVVLVERAADQVTVDVIVSDDGIGIDEATLARLFTPFSQADASTTRRFGGSGLGLAISGMLVSLMGGKISVASAPGQGATFTVRLPFTAVAAGDADVDVDALALRGGVTCRIVGSELPLGDDLAAYLADAHVVVERSPDLAAAAAAAPPPGLSLWMLLPGITQPEIGELRALAPCAPGVGTHFIALGWGGRRRLRVEADDLVTLDADTLFRRTLLRAVALASGRMKEEPPPEIVSDRGEQAPPSRETARLQRRLILVAEDNETNRVVILRQLGMIGFAAEVAVDGQDALHRWRSGDFALVLTDLHMPQLDGYALTRAIRSEEPAGRRTSIIALTANALRDEELRCLAAGMDAYLSKPVRLAQLRTSIEAWLGPAAQAAAMADDSRDPIAATPPADLNVLKALVGDDPAVVEEVLKSFRDSADLSRDELSHGVLAGAGQAVADAAHKLKSAARSIGALRVGDLCSEIEGAAAAGRTDELKALLPLFLTELNAVLAFLDSRHDIPRGAARAESPETE